MFRYIYICLDINILYIICIYIISYMQHIISQYNKYIYNT